MKKLTLVAVGFMILVVVFATPTSAGNLNGELNDDTDTVGAGGSAPGGSADGGGGGGGSTGEVSAGSLGTWVPALLGYCWDDGTVNLSNIPLPDGFAAPLPGGELRDPATADGRLLLWILVSPTGEALATWFHSECAEAAFPAPVAPPAPVDIWKEAPLPLPKVLTSPERRGLVGIENWFWYDGITRVTVPPVQIGGWTVSAEANLAEVRWELGDGRTISATDTLPGSKRHPAATAIYQVAGTYVITAHSIWQGTATISGFGFTFTQPRMVSGCCTTSRQSKLTDEARRLRNLDRSIAGAGRPGTGRRWA